MSNVERSACGVCGHLLQPLSACAVIGHLSSPPHCHGDCCALRDGVRDDDGTIVDAARADKPRMPSIPPLRPEIKLHRLTARGTTSPKAF